MRAMIRNYIQAEKARREESGEAGFSLIELIVVVVILGVLAAVAIPMFMNMQDQAATNALKSIAANGATQVAAAVASDDDDAPAAGEELANLSKDGVTVTVVELTASDVDSICVTAAKDGKTAAAGPGANAAGTGCS